MVMPCGTTDLGQSGPRESGAEPRRTKTPDVTVLRPLATACGRVFSIIMQAPRVTYIYDIAETCKMGMLLCISIYLTVARDICILLCARVSMV